MSEMCCTRLAENTRRKKFAIWASSHNFVGLHLRNATKGCIVNPGKTCYINISSACAHNMANFGPLTAEIVSGVWGNPANFNRFRILPSLLQRRRSPEANQTARCLAVSSTGTLYMYIYIFGGFCPLAMQNSLYVQALRYTIQVVSQKASHLYNLL